MRTDLVNKLKNGKVAIKFNYQNIEEKINLLNQVLESAFPTDCEASGNFRYYFRSSESKNNWFFSDDVDDIPDNTQIVSLDDFFVTENPEVNNYEIF